MQNCIFIAIAGGSASGKKSVQTLLQSTLTALYNSTPNSNTFTVETLHQGDFLKPPASPPLTATTTTTTTATTAISDPERLDAYDLDALSDVIHRVRESERGVIVGDRTLAFRPDVLIVEGTYVLCHVGIVAMADVKIFVDCDADVRLARRVVRDLEELGIPLDAIFEHHVRFGKTAHQMHILPTKQMADIILPGASIATGVELVAQGVMDDVRGGRVRRGSGSGNSGVGSMMGMLSEADFTGGAPSYYETV